MAPMSMLQLEVTQTLPYPGKRAARVKAAAAETAANAAAIEAVRAELATAVRVTYASLFALDREREAVVAAQELTKALLEAVAVRLSAGRGEAEGVEKVALERLRLAERLTDLDAERTLLVVRLDRLLAHRRTRPLPPIRELPAPPASLAGLVKRGLEEAPSLAVSEAMIAAAREKLDVAKLEKQPNFLVGIGAGAAVDGTPVLMGRFGMELPIWVADKQEPLARAARHDLEAAEHEREVASLEVRAASARLVAELERAGAQADRYRNAIVPQTANVLKAATASYVTGTGDFSTLFEDFRMWLDARVGLARREADRYIAWAELEGLAGGAPEGRAP